MSVYSPLSDILMDASGAKFMAKDQALKQNILYELYADFIGYHTPDTLQQQIRDQYASISIQHYSPLFADSHHPVSYPHVSLDIGGAVRRCFQLFP